MVKQSLLMASLLCLACSQESDRRVDERPPQPTRTSTAIKVTTAVPGGTKIPCDKLIDAALLTQQLGEKDPVSLSDHTKDEMDATAVCSVRRGGKPVSRKEQERRSKDTMKLGVLPGDELCNIAAYCSIPPDEDALKKKCENDHMQSNDAIGVFACVKVTPKGPDDAYTYKFLDPDSRCILQVRGGPSVNDEGEVQQCAKAALLLISRDSLPNASDNEDG